MSRKIDNEVLKLSLKIAAHNNLENDYPSLKKDIASVLSKQNKVSTAQHIAYKSMPNIIGRDLCYAEVIALSNILDKMVENNLILKDKVINPDSLFHPMTCKMYDMETLSVYYSKYTINPLEGYIMLPVSRKICKDN
jgi:hypothetical protein